MSAAIIDQDKIAELIDSEGVGALVRFVADVTTKIAACPISEALRLASEATAGADHIMRCKGTIEDAERGVRDLDGFALTAKAAVGAVLGELEAGGKGKAKSPRAEACELAGISRPDAARMIKLAEIEPDDRARLADSLEGKGKRLTVRGVLAAAESPSSAEDYDGDEWYTDPDFLAAARKAGGGRIDCDLTSCLLAQRHVKAKVWYSLRSPKDEEEQAKARAAGMTQAEIEKACACWGGLGKVEKGRLTQEPMGYVFGQPPYSDPAPTIRTILDGYHRKLVTAATILVNVATGSAAQQELLELSTARLWVGKGDDNPKARMSFISPSGAVAKANRYDQVAYYLGNKMTTFAAAFGGWGVVKIG